MAWTAAGMYGKDLISQLIVMALPHLGISMTNYTMKQYQRQTYVLVFQVCGWSAGWVMYMACLNCLVVWRARWLVMTLSETCLSASSTTHA